MLVPVVPNQLEHKEGFACACGLYGGYSVGGAEKTEDVGVGCLVVRVEEHFFTFFLQINVCNYAVTNPSITFNSLTLFFYNQ